MSFKFALRIFLAVLTSPAWLPAYVGVVGMGYVAAILINIFLFTAKGKTDWDLIQDVNDFAKLRFLRAD